MATLYVTSSADSGDGTLRDCVSKASDGDVVTSAIPRICVIASPLSISAAITFKNIRIQGGNGSQMSLQVRGACVFEDCQFSFLVKTSSGGPLWIYSAGTNSIFRRCIFFRNFSEGNASCVYVASGVDASFYDCLFISNCASNAALYFAGDSNNGVIRNCTIYDNCGGDINKSAIKSACVDCLLADTPSSAFVNPINSTDPDEWEYVDYMNCDYYLSSKIQGGANSTLDVFGNPRGNTKGAIEFLDVDYFTDGSDVWADYAQTQLIANAFDADYTNKKVAIFENGVVVNSLTKILDGRPTFYVANRWNTGELTTANCYLDATEYGIDYVCADFVLSRFAILDDAVGIEVVGKLTLNEGATTRATFVRAAPISFSATFESDVVKFSVVKTNNYPVAIYRGSVYLGQDIASATISDTSQAIDFTCDDGTEQIVASTVRTYYYKGGESGSFTNPSDWAVDEDKQIACVDAPTIAGCTFIATD